MKLFTPYRHECEKTITLNGQEIAYTLTAEDYLLYSDTGEADATMFSYSYVRQPADPTRPVLFVYNGGPGSDSIWLHLGFMGPRVLKVAEPPERLISFPYALSDNDKCLLDVCDMVFIDPVGVGFARLLDSAAAEKYYETGGDAVSFAKLMEDWMVRHNRWNSPVYLMGESYGTIRNVALADVLPDSIHLAGIVSVGTSINHGMPELQVEPTVRKFGAFTAAAWHHKRDGKPDFDEHLRQAEEFAYTDYAKALLWGRMLPRDEYEAVLDKTVWFTGMTREYLEANRLRIDLGEFLCKLCPGYIVSRYDARLKAATRETSIELFSAKAMAIEPFNNALNPAFRNVLRQYHDGLGILPGREYITETLHIGLGWNYKKLGKDIMVMLESNLKRRPDCKIFFVNGAYDMLSTAGFVRYYLAQYDIPDDRTMVRVYQSGHMSYLGAAFDPMSDDLREFILK